VKRETVGRQVLGHDQMMMLIKYDQEMVGTYRGVKQPVPYEVLMRYGMPCYSYAYTGLSGHKKSR
jgi:hypothetical protein